MDFGWENFPYDKIWTKAGEFQAGSIFEVVHIESKDGTWGNDNFGSNLFNTLSTNSGGTIIFQPITDYRQLRETDARLRITVLLQNDILPDDVQVGMSATPANTGCYKWWVRPSDRPQSNASDNGRNYRIMRMGEIILWYAEALNETGNPVKATEQLNKLRIRAQKIAQSDSRAQGFDSKPTLLTPGSYLTVRKNIWNEREIELAFEFDRFWDIVRQRNAKSLYDKYNNIEDIFDKHFKEGINEVFPIPQNEIDLSNGVVLQNPGY